MTVIISAVVGVVTYNFMLYNRCVAVGIPMGNIASINSSEK